MKFKKAVALKYKMGDFAPRVIAKGKGYVAKKIIEKAKKENIDVVKDDNITEQLFNIDLNQYISEDLYEAVANILIFIGYLDEKRAKKDIQNE